MASIFLSREFVPKSTVLQQLYQLYQHNHHHHDNRTVDVHPTLWSPPPESCCAPKENSALERGKLLEWDHAGSSNYGIIWGEILRWILNDGIRVAHDTIIDRIVGIRLVIPVCDSLID